MREALLRTYNAAPEPKWVVALGDCATNCGVFAGSPAVVGPLADILPVDLHVPGCPPRPLEPVERTSGIEGLLPAMGDRTLKLLSAPRCEPGGAYRGSRAACRW
jgi:Ni,Fe-hydrogenase III small subunit